MSRRAYGRIHASFWTSPTIRALGDDGRTLAAYLLTGPHSNMLGAYRLPFAYAADDLDWGTERVAQAFRVLADRGFAKRDDETSWVLVYRYIHWNPAENPNQAKAIRKLLMEVPVDKFRRAIARLILARPQWFDVPELQALAEGSERVPEHGSGSGDRDRSGDRDQDQDPGERASAPPEVIPERSSDPYGIAPPGENPDAYPGSVTPQLALVPPDPKPSKPDPVRQVFEAYLAGWRSKVGRGVEPVLTDKRRALVRTRLKELSLEALLAAAAGIWCSSWHVENRRTDFDLALRDAAHVERFAGEHADAKPAPPKTPEAPRVRRHPIGPHDSVEDQIQHFVRQGMNIPPPLLALREKELAAAKEAAAAADAPPVVGPRTPMPDDSDVPF